MRSRHGAGWSVSQAATLAAVRPLDVSQQPGGAGGIDDPGHQRSATSTHRPVAASWAPRRFPRQISSIPSTLTGGGAANHSCTCATNAECAIGHDTP